MNSGGFGHRQMLIIVGAAGNQIDVACGYLTKSSRMCRWQAPLIILPYCNVFGVDRVTVSK